MVVQRIKEAKLISDISNELVDRLRETKIKELFKKLDTDNDGIVSFQNLDFKFLEQEEVLLLSPYFMSLAEQ